MKFDIVGVGNALVDETFYVDKQFVDSTDLFFNQFKAITFEEQELILSNLPPNQIAEVVCGGSTTNSLAAAANYGSKCAHICQLGKDERGKQYEQDLEKNSIYVVNKFHHESHRTGRCLVFITPNSERTMGTYLGASEMLEFSMDFMDVVNNSKILFTEGYQFTSDQNFKAFLSVLENTDPNVQLALSLSDPFVVSNFKSRFEDVFSKRIVDYVFCNKEEAIAMAGENFVGGLGRISKNFVVTDGANSSVISEEGNISEIEAHAVKAIDSNGAGDIYAGSVLHKIVQGKNFRKACEFGNFASSIIVQEKSPRLSVEGYKNLQEQFEHL